MKKVLIFLTLSCVFSLIAFYSYGQDETIKEGRGNTEEEFSKEVFVIREAKDFRDVEAAVEGFLIDNIFEVLVEARLIQQRPRISYVAVVGPKLGRKSFETKRSVLKGIEEDMPFETTEEQGVFRLFGKRKKERKLKGTVTKEIFQIRIPAEKIKNKKRYWLWVYVESKQQGSTIHKFKFELKDFPRLLEESMERAEKFAQRQESD